ncbi:hypothetical protein JL193_08255 [Polaribacter batillariae]|uniref:Lipoprotein n=1 Tax=Polaribacter batillariae TaxID=2808900 RepID=A0ABX7SZW1_9FLAO|nr:hypothetical protein [Polaribacter batillariae]QTD39214.1 hypothetical protein JL193_08255 [Polaribacter batillariae]
MKRIIIFLAFVSVIGCSEKEDIDNAENNIDINLVTGINLIDFTGGKIGQLGNPNELNIINFGLYPNPTVDILNVYSMGIMSEIWIRPANSSKNYLQTDFGTILNSELYSENEIEKNSKIKLTNSGLSKIKIDLRSLEIGYYRVFVKVDGSIFWRNIYVGTNTSELDNLKNDWN